MAFAEGNAREVTVTGRAEVRIVPNEIVLSFAVETLDEDLHRSKQENDRIVNAALSAVRAIGMTANQVKTDYIVIEPVYTNARTGNQFKGFQVKKSIVISLQDVSRFEEVLSSVLEAGVNRVKGIDFRTTDFRQHRDSAMLLALDAAKVKAAAMAEQLGAQIGKPLSIKEGTSSYRPSPSNTIQNSSSVSEWMAGPLAPGQLAIPAIVTVTFELVD